MSETVSSGFPASKSFPAQGNGKPVSDMVAPDPPAGMKPRYRSNKDDPPILLQTPTRLNYVTPTTVKAIVKRDPKGYDSDTIGATWDSPIVWINNGRNKNYSLHTNGFELVRQDTIFKDIDFMEKNDVMDRYYPYCEKFLETFLGNEVKVTAFDHNVRKQSSDGDAMKPLGLVHGDYTESSGPRRLQLLAEPPKMNDVWRERLGDGALLDSTTVQECVSGKRRFALINVWRNIDIQNPVQTLPLACVDAKTHTRDDLRVLEVHYVDRVGENFLVCPTDRLQWVYFPNMQYEEALLIKQWDSSGGLAQGLQKDDKVSTMSLHSAFLDACSKPNDPPRQSIEVRCVAIWRE